MHMTQWRSHTPSNSDSEWIFFTSEHETRIHTAIKRDNVKTNNISRSNDSGSDDGGRDSGGKHISHSHVRLCMDFDLATMLARMFHVKRCGVHVLCCVVLREPVCVCERMALVLLPIEFSYIFTFVVRVGVL